MCKFLLQKCPTENAKRRSNVSQLNDKGVHECIAAFDSKQTAFSDIQMTFLRDIKGQNDYNTGILTTGKATLQGLIKTLGVQM